MCDLFLTHTFFSARPSSIRLARPVHDLPTLAWVKGTSETMFLKVNRAYHKFGARLEVRTLPLGSHESKPHISRFGRQTMQTNSNQSIRAVVAILDKTATCHHRLYGLMYTATFARKTQQSQNSIEVWWERAQKVASLGHGLRKWRHLYFSCEFLVRFGNQAARTSRFNGGRKLMDLECKKKRNSLHRIKMKLGQLIFQEGRYWVGEQKNNCEFDHSSTLKGRGLL